MQRELILTATLKVFHEKGVKLTMDDIAKSAGMSKKTLYRTFSDKEDLFLKLVDYLFDSVKEGEKKILENREMTTPEKLKEILVVLPDGYKDLGYEQLYMLQEKYPAVYEKVKERLETGWEGTLALMEEGIAKGELRKVNLVMVKLMLEATWERFFQSDVLVRNQITYPEALEEVVGIILQGIVMPEHDI